MCPRFGPAAQEVVCAASLAAFDLMEYRHAVMHGSMLPSPTMPTFIRRPAWNGEIRQRPRHDAHVDVGTPRAARCAHCTSFRCYTFGAAGFFFQCVDVHSCGCEKSDGLGVLLLKKRFAGGDERLIRSRRDVEKVHVFW